jgi:hypothetical protein
MMCPTDERERQKSDWHGASVLQKASHLRQLFPTQDGAEHDTLQEMQSGACFALAVFFFVFHRAQP